MNSKFNKHILKKIGLILLGIFCVLAVRSVVVEPFRIPSDSMEPTLFAGDFILVNKMAYGLKIPFTGFNLFGFNSNPFYLFKHHLPKRGDIVVFKYPRDKSINFIKRIVALPGDTVEMRNKEIFINGTLMPSTRLDKKKFSEKFGEGLKNSSLNLYTSASGDRRHFIQIDEDSFYGTDFSVKKIPENMYFVLGDNRDFSYDSRFWGSVPGENIKGKVFMVWFSLDIDKNSSEDLFKFNPDRTGIIVN